jgi:hypothetical protein
MNVTLVCDATQFRLHQSRCLRTALQRSTKAQSCIQLMFTCLR